MNRIISAALGAAIVAAIVAVPAPAAAQERFSYDRDYDRGHDRDYRDSDRRMDRYRRDLRRAIRRGNWNSDAFNGYTYRGRWHYGQPPSSYHNDPYFDPGYRAWRRGDRLPSYYRDSYRDVDWRDCGLSAPPRGYRYVEDDRGNYLLVAIATGVILSVLLGQ